MTQELKHPSEIVERRNMPFPTERRGFALLNIYDTLKNDLVASYNIWRREADPKNKNSKYSESECLANAKRCQNMIDCMKKSDYGNFLEYKDSGGYVFQRYRTYWVNLGYGVDGKTNYRYDPKLTP